MAEPTVYPSTYTIFCAFRKIKDLDYTVLILKLAGILQQIPLNITIRTIHSPEDDLSLFSAAGTSRHGRENHN